MKICIIGSHQKGYDDTCRVIRSFVREGWEVLSPRLETKHDEGLVLTVPCRHTLSDLKKALNQADVLYIHTSKDSHELEYIEEMKLATSANKPIFASAIPPVREIAEKVDRICPPEDVMRLLAIQACD